MFACCVCCVNSNNVAQKPPKGPVLGELLLNQCSTPNADWNVIVFAVSHQPAVQVSSHGDADHLATVFKSSHFYKDSKKDIKSALKCSSNFSG